MEIGEKKSGDVLVVSPQGSLDFNNSNIFQTRIQEILAGGVNKMVINFSETDFVSSAGLRVLIFASKQMQAKGGSVVLCSMSESVKEVFDIAGFTSIFDIYDSEEEAVISIN